MADLNTNYTDVEIIRTNLQKEQDAISTYESQLQYVQDERVSKVIQSILDEERVHVGELTELLTIIHPSEADQLDRGAVEVRDTLSERRILRRSIVSALSMTEAGEMSYTIEYREDGETKYSSVKGRSESDALSNFNKMIKGTNRKVSSPKVVSSDLSDTGDYVEASEMTESNEDKVKLELQSVLREWSTDPHDFVDYLDDLGYEVVESSEDSIVFVTPYDDTEYTLFINRVGSNTYTIEYGYATSTD